MNLNQVTLPSADVERSVTFYRTLGFKLIVRDLPKYARFECPVGGSTFSLHQMATLVLSSTVVYFECANVDATCADLAARGVNFDALPTDRPWLWREAYLRDPDGNVLCLYHAGENRLNPPWRL